VTEPTPTCAHCGKDMPGGGLGVGDERYCDALCMHKGPRRLDSVKEIGKLSTMWAHRIAEGWTDVRVWRCTDCRGLVVTGKADPIYHDGKLVHDGSMMVHERNSAGGCPSWVAWANTKVDTPEQDRANLDAYKRKLELIAGPHPKGWPLPKLTEWAKKRPAGAKGHVRTAVCMCGEYVKSFRCHGDRIILHDGHACSDYCGLSPSAMHKGRRPKINRDWYLDQLVTVEVEDEQ